MPDYSAVPQRPAPQQWAKGTRTMRVRTARKAGLVPGQPQAPLTSPRAAPQGKLARHRCAECFGPRSAYRTSPFCSRCERTLFGWHNDEGYRHFLRGERIHVAYRRKKWAAAGYVPPDHSKEKESAG